MEELCSPICPFRSFLCTKKALVIRRRRDRLEALCTWTGDRCIGYRCQFAICTRHALLPDGQCGLRVKRGEERRSIDEEALSRSDVRFNISRRLKKRGIEIDEV